MSNQSKPPVPAPARHPGTPDSAQGAQDPFEDDLKVPKGVSRTQFLIIVVLMIFMTVIFIVGDSIQNMVGGGRGEDPVVTRFTVPGKGEVEWQGSDIVMRARELETAIGFDQFLAFSLGITDMRNPDLAEFERVLILNELAQASGVEVTDSDLAEHLREMLSFQQGTPETFQAVVRAQGIDQRRLEEAIRMMMRVSRFTQMIGFAGAVPTPEAIEKRWHEDNVELAFDYAYLEVASLKEEARKDLPDDAKLQAWFDKLPESERNEFRTEEKRTAEVVLFRDAETTGADALVAAFPEKTPEGVEPTAPEELAQQYYNRVFVRRFAKEAVEGATEPAGFLSFDEVKEQCLADAPVYFALTRWLEDLNARKTNGETIDLAAEAAKYGLEHQAYLQAQTRAGFEGADGANDKDVAQAVFATSPDGSFYASPMATRTGLHVVRANSRVEREMPAFDSIRDRVIEKWLGPRTEELADKKLVALREAFESFEPPKDEDNPFAAQDTTKHWRSSPEAFKAAVEGAGLTLARRDFLNKAGPATDDPEHENEHHKTLVAQAYSFRLYDLEADEVAAPGLDSAKKYAYLVRHAGSREVPLTKMSPTQYQNYKRQARTSAAGDVAKKIDFAFLEQNFGLWRLEPVEEDAAEAAPAN